MHASGNRIVGWVEIKRTSSAEGYMIKMFYEKHKSVQKIFSNMRIQFSIIKQTN